MSQDTIEFDESVELEKDDLMSKEEIKNMLSAIDEVAIDIATLRQ